MPSFHPFRHLPPELRDQIYLLTLIPDNNLSLLATSRQIRHEALQSLHRNATYSLTIRYFYSPEGERKVEGIDFGLFLLPHGPLRISEVEKLFLANRLSGRIECGVGVCFDARRVTRAASVDLKELKDSEGFWDLVRHVVGQSFWTVVPYVPWSV